MTVKSPFGFTSPSAKVDIIILSRQQSEVVDSSSDPSATSRVTLRIQII